MQLESRRELTERQLKPYFSAEQASVLAQVITDAYQDLVKTSDFNELKAIVRELAEAQKRTEQQVEELVEAQKRTEQQVEELAEAQKRTEQQVEELAEAQKRTEQRVDTLALRMEELAEAQRQTADEIRILARGLNETRTELGGLSRSFGYALENEAYRMLPAFLADKYGLSVSERLIRTEIGGEEINLFGRAKRDGQEVLIVGEAKLQLANPQREEEALAQLADKVAVVRKAMPKMEVVPLLITHYARPAFLARAKAQGIIVAQSYEW
ncbi:hypothetical protein [Candidatus Roseilinea sp. NK_OTU-006]|uniref:hypothetical protein n=1 Tax=Candidatus Roseilinea sp. NK_OTU-006 TaxID=2704250 RepID=UPI00145D6A74|nr:hypothetical protein [Candidatus Roseilinea sp. NK_OTU-006]